MKIAARVVLSLLAVVMLVVGLWWGVTPKVGVAGDVALIPLVNLRLSGTVMDFAVIVIEGVLLTVWIGIARVANVFPKP